MKAWDDLETVFRRCLFVVGVLTVSASCAGSAEDDGAGGDGDGDGAGTGGEMGSGGADGAGGSATGGDAGVGGSPASGGGSTGGAASGGDSGDGGSPPGTGGASGGMPGCAAESAGPALGRNARSSGFSGTDEAYSELYSDPCEEDGDCAAPCEARGGTPEFCATSVCIVSMPNYCLPPTKWRSLDGALSVGETTADAAVTSLSLSNGDEHDLLLVDDFGLDVPMDATIVGIVASVRKAKGVTEMVTDYAVQLIRGGELVGEDRGSSEQWPTTLTAIEYGSESDLWGESWLPEDVNDAEFGIALGALPGQSSGRAYVDAVEITVFYTPICP